MLSMNAMNTAYSNRNSQPKPHAHTMNCVRLQFYWSERCRSNVSIGTDAGMLCSSAHLSTEILVLIRFTKRLIICFQ